MNNSSLVDCIVKSPNHSGQRTHAVDRITPHCVVGQLKAENIGGCFTSENRKASSNYGIGYDGRVCLIVDEDNRSWCSSNASNDQRAITIECASDKTSPYALNDAVYSKLIDLCVDICKRYGKKKLIWTDNKAVALNYVPKNDEMILTVHRWFSNTDCPGDWLYKRLNSLAEVVTNRLMSASFRVRVDIDDLNIRKGPGTNYSKNGKTGKGVFTIIETKSGRGSKQGWGKLKSGAGWISLDYVHIIE